ncbi:MAG: HlyD family efflux transporter periplasmic adaptor subunit [Pseudomonadales bacterium]
MRKPVMLYLLTLLLAACDVPVTPEPTVVGTTEYIRIELTAQSSEQIIAIHVKEGDAVSTNQLILEQDPDLYQAQLEQLQAARDKASHRLAELVRGPRDETIALARAKLQGVLNTLVIQEREYQRISELVTSRLASPSEQDRTRELLELARANRDMARAELDALLAGTTTEELAQARAALAETEAAIKTQEILTARLAIRAPTSGIIDALPFREGERPPAAATVAVMLADGLPYARVYIPEPLRSRITPGTDARIRVDGMERIFTGRVRYVSSEAAFTPYFALTQHDRGRLSYVAEIDFIEDSASGIPGGVPVEVSFPDIPQG